MNSHRFFSLMTVVISGLLIACSTTVLNLPPGEDTLEKIEAGMEEKTVKLLAGEPDRVEQTPYGAHVLYYRESLVSDCAKDLAGCVPIVVAGGQVAAIGQQWFSAWKNEQKEAAADKIQRLKKARAAASDQKKTEGPLRLNGSDMDRQPDDATRAQITRLEKEVRRIPVSRTMDNLKIYRYLHKLDPENAKYVRKVAFYEAQLERDQERRAEAKKREIAKRRQQNEVLKAFEGNDRVRMAIENLGGGQFHVWIENRLLSPIEVTPGHFTLVCTNKSRFAVYQTKDFNDTVAPGEIIDGRLAFDAYCPPREIVFAHPSTGRLTRVFPPIPPDVPGTAPPTP